MTEYEVPAASKPRRSPWGAILFLFVLALLAAAAWGGWRVWKARQQTEDTVAAQDVLLRRLSRQLGDTQAELQSLRERQGDLLETAKRTVDDVAALQGRADDADATIARLNAALQGGRGRAQLVAVEQLLMIANERALLAHDVRGTLDALNLAQERLGALAEPRLFPIREALAQERAAVQAVPAPDLEAAALTLSALIEQAPTLLQRARAPHHLAVDPADDDTLASEPSGALARAWRNVREVLGAVFILRRTDKPVDRLLPVEQEALVGQLLLLKLESARAALLAGNAEALQAAVNEAINFLVDYYRPDDAAVLAARASLESMRKLDPVPKQPELSRSLGLLRAYLDANPR